ncbi:MAG: branched-chain amino acid ABC transporter permease [Anaerolineaceae bacterium]|nr:branched-chain amino acid ABC transporter permease [Anaerolineaceae bacterium]
MSIYIQGIIYLISINLISVMGLSLLTGFTGSFCFGQAGFMAVGAYVSGMLTKMAGLPIWLGVICGALAGALISIPIGLPTLKLKGDYFAIATLGFAEAVRLILENLQKYTGGARGIPGIPTLKSPVPVMLIAVLVYVLIRFYVSSSHGRKCIAIREDEMAAKCIGINAPRMKTISFFVNGFLAGLSGALLAHYVGFIQPSMFGMPKSTELIIMVIFGGMHSVTGALISTILLTSLPELLRAASIWRLVAYGLLVVIIMIVRPEGLLGTWELSWKNLKTAWQNLFHRKAAAKEGN